MVLYLSIIISLGGGIETLPGFQANSLGPFNPNSPYGPGTINACSPGNLSNCNRMGGNVEVLGGVNLIFPNPLGERFRTSFFVDAGNIFDTYKAQYSAAQVALNPNLQAIPYENLSFSNLRVSTGLMLEWWSPMGPLSLDIAYPIVKKKSDNVSWFGFTLGASI